MGLAETDQSIRELSVTLIHKHTVDICGGMRIVCYDNFQVMIAAVSHIHLVSERHLPQKRHPAVKPTVRTEHLVFRIFHIDLPHVIIPRITSGKTYTGRNLLNLEVHLNRVAGIGCGIRHVGEINK